MVDDRVRDVVSCCGDEFGGENSTVGGRSTNATTTTTNFSVKGNHFVVDFYLDDPPHPLNPQDVGGCFGMASAAIMGYDLDQKFPRRGGRLKAGNVVLNINCLSAAFTWGLFDFMLRPVQALLAARGWWSCSWEMRGTEGRGGKRVVYARGRLWSPLGKDDVAPA